MKRMNEAEVRGAAGWLRHLADHGELVTISDAFARVLANHLEADLPVNRERKSA